MFVVAEAGASEIRAIVERNGELAAAIGCAGGSLASSATGRRGNAPGASRDGPRSLSRQPR
jgi:hypothetical protein